MNRRYETIDFNRTFVFLAISVLKLVKLGEILELTLLNTQQLLIVSRIKLKFY